MVLPCGRRVGVTSDALDPFVQLAGLHPLGFAQWPTAIEVRGEVDDFVRLVSLP
jgi:hypothetical protein